MQLPHHCLIFDIITITSYLTISFTSLLYLIFLVLIGIGLAMKNFHYYPRLFIICLVLIRLACIKCPCTCARIHMVSVRESPLFFTSCGVTRQCGKKSEEIHPFLTKVNRLLYIHVNFLALRTFQAF